MQIIEPLWSIVRTSSKLINYISVKGYCLVIIPVVLYPVSFYFSDSPMIFPFYPQYGPFINP